jgi:PAS domain S-box-containing protein
MLNLIKEGLSKLDLAGNYISINKSYADALGSNPEELIGKNWLIAFHPGDAARAQELLRRVTDGEQSAQARLLGAKSNGAKFEQQVFIYPIRDPVAQILSGYYLFVIDVQHQVEARKEIRGIISGITELKTLFENYLKEE